MASLQVQVGKNPRFYYMDFILRIQQGNLVPAWIYGFHHPWCVQLNQGPICHLCYLYDEWKINKFRL
jgi:hypothetical protein